MKKNKRNKRKNIKLELSKSESDEVLLWSKAQTENPDLNKDVRKVLEDLVSILDGGENAEQKMDNLRKALAISMRILPSSERRVPEDPLKTGVLKDVEDKLLRARRIARFAGLRVKGLEELAEKLREIYQKEREESESSNSSQDGDDDAENDEPENEAVFGAAVVKRGVVVTDLRSLLVPGTEKGKFVTIIERKRTDLQLTSSEYVFRGQEYFDPETGERGSYDFSLVGPPEFSFTHRACIHIVMQVVGLGMPLARLERMLGGTPFSRQSLHRIIGYVAYHLAPVYLQLCDELSEAPLLLMDDTHTRVVEVDKALLGGGPYPWDEPPKNKKKGGIKDNEPEPVRSLVLRLKEHFRYAFPQVRDPQKIKTQHLTSCVHGIPSEQKTRIVIYRSHLGSAGNLLEGLLARRTAKNRELSVVADLSTTNLVRDEELKKKFNITYAGCAAHARRPFFRYAEHEPEASIEILDNFKFIFEVERIVQDASPQQIEAMRSHAECGALPIWQDTLNRCEKLAETFSASTPLGEGARYVIRNFEALTAYLRRGDLPATNNQTERLLRFEKLAERNTYGSKTVEGRMRMDVLRSVLTTCRFSGLNENLYLLKILTTPADHIAAHSDKFTPSAIKAYFEKHPLDRVKLEALLNTTDYGAFVKSTTNFARNSDTND